MIGTFQEEKEDEEIVCGLVDPVNSFNPLYLQLINFHISNSEYIKLLGISTVFSIFIKIGKRTSKVLLSPIPLILGTQICI